MTNITMKDIARESGVSRSVVSFVLNGRDAEHGIATQTRERVLAVAAKLGYCRNELARAVITGQSRIIAFVTIGSPGTHEYIARITAGIFDELSARDYSLKIFYLNPEKIEQTIQKLRESRIAGVIWHAVRHGQVSELTGQLREYRIPSVSVNLSSRDYGIGVVSDDSDGIVQVVRYICGRGFRRLGYIGSPSSIEYVVNRRDGFWRGIKESGADGELFCFAGSEDWRQEVFGCAQRAWEAGCRAMITETDNTAAAVMQWAVGQGIRLPDELAVTGFSNMALAPFCTVPLTTVDQPLELIGRTAASELLEWLDRGSVQYFSECRNVVLPVSLCIRDSVGKGTE